MCANTVGDLTCDVTILVAGKHGSAKLGKVDQDRYNIVPVLCLSTLLCAYLCTRWHAVVGYVCV
jgi:hypothetical protein